MRTVYNVIQVSNKEEIKEIKNKSRNKKHFKSKLYQKYLHNYEYA